CHIFITGSSILGGGVRAPRSLIRCAAAFPCPLPADEDPDQYHLLREVVAIYGVVRNFSRQLDAQLMLCPDYWNCFALFWGGLTQSVRACNLLCGVCVGITSSEFYSRPFGCR
ncbi:hypothetical protein BDZ89DRAFT_1241495, partial [Hymenopellis radicata]